MSALPFGFGAPWYLLLLLLLPFLYLSARQSLAGLSPGRRWFALVLRVVVFLALVLALAEFRLMKANSSLTVIFVMDRSESIPAEQREAARRYVIGKALERDPTLEDRVGVVTFGKRAGIEWIPKAEDLDIESFLTLVEPEGTDIAAAIRLAAAAFPEQTAKRIVLLSDGNQNRGDVLEEVRIARGQGITVDVVPITYSHPSEITVEKLLVDTEVGRGQPFDITVVVNSTHETDATLRLFEGERLVSSADARHIKRGKNVFSFGGLSLDRSGLFVYEVRLEPLSPEDDGLLENNTAAGFTVVVGEPKLLLCAPDPEEDRALVDALRGEQLEVEVTTPSFLPRRPEEYLQYDAIILSNVGAHELSESTMELFEGLVKAVGLGFVMIGGENSFGAGGYRGTPVETLLPVEMEIKQRKTLPNGALGLVVHSCELANGNWWAGQVIRRAVSILSPRDYVGVISYDMGQDRWLFPMTPIAQRQRMLSLLRGFNPGDMPAFQNIMTLALKGLQNTPASIKHMIVLTDGDPAPPSPALVSAIRKARITISTICYGAHGSIPTAMQDLARDGGGKFHYLKSGDDLPEIFIREAITITKSLISEETFQPVAQGVSPILKGLGELPQLNGFVLTTPKPLATVALVRPAQAKDPSQDPILAIWSYGVGKAIAFTSDAGRRWGAQWASWESYSKFWSQCMRSVMRTRSDDRFRITRTVEGSEGRVSIDAIDPEGRFVNGLAFDAKVVSPDFETFDTTVRQVAPGRYEAAFPAERQGSYTLSLNYEREGARVVLNTGLNVPYSAEYRRLESDHEVLERIAAVGAGRYFEDPATASVFSRDFEVTREVQDVWHELLLAAIALFFLDVFVRRVAIEYREMLRNAWRWLLERVGSRVPATGQADSRLGSLLARKEKLRAETTARYQPPTDDGGRTGIHPATWDAGSGQGGMAPPQGAPPATAKQGRSEKQPAEHESSAYTARLLEAKRRARQKGTSQDQSKEGNK